MGWDGMGQDGTGRDWTGRIRHLQSKNDSTKMWLFYLVIFQPGAGNLPRAALPLRFDLQAEQSLILLKVLSKQLIRKEWKKQWIEKDWLLFLPDWSRRTSEWELAMWECPMWAASRPPGHCAGCSYFCLTWSWTSSHLGQLVWTVQAVRISVKVSF